MSSKLAQTTALRIFFSKTYAGTLLVNHEGAQRRDCDVPVCDDATIYGIPCAELKEIGNGHLEVEAGKETRIIPAIWALAVSKDLI